MSTGEAFPAEPEAEFVLAPTPIDEDILDVLMHSSHGSLKRSVFDIISPLLNDVPETLTTPVYRVVQAPVVSHNGDMRFPYWREFFTWVEKR